METSVTRWSELFKGKFVAHPLYPERDARRDHKLVLESLVKFLHKYGYWPTTGELAEMLRADMYGTVFCCQNLEKLGLAQPNHRRGSRRYYELTASGWATLGLQPIEPWIKRPKTLLTRIAHKVTLDLADVEAAQRQLAERAGTPLKMDGRRMKYASKRYLAEGERQSQPKPTVQIRKKEQPMEKAPWLP